MPRDNRVTKCSVNGNPFFYWIVSVICVNGCLGHHGGKQFSFTPETNAHVESRQISKPNLVLKSSYKQRPCEGIYILPSRVRFYLRIPRFSSVCTWISHKCTVYIYIYNNIFIYTYMNVHLRLYAFDFAT